MRNQVDPGRIVCTIEENFKAELGKPKLRNLILTSIAIGKTEKLRINEIARNLPVDVKHKKSRQTSLLRFLDSFFRRIMVERHVGMLSSLVQWGYFRNVVYHMAERIQVKKLVLLSLYRSR